jgi:aryl-phospho-beta-D-glucosidase BglC (GH1 family)
MQRGTPPPALTLREDKFVEVASGQTVALKGYSWFGFNNGQTSVDGLWAGGCAYHTDFASVVYQMQLLGFNAIRLPFLFK